MVEQYSLSLEIRDITMTRHVLAICNLSAIQTIQQDRNKSWLNGWCVSSWNMYLFKSDSKCDLCVCAVSDGLTESQSSIKKQWRSHLLNQGLCKLPLSRTDRYCIAWLQHCKAAQLVHDLVHQEDHSSDSDFFPHAFWLSFSLFEKKKKNGPNPAGTGFKILHIGNAFCKAYSPTWCQRSELLLLSSWQERVYVNASKLIRLFHGHSQLLPRLASSSIDYCEQKLHGCFYFAFPWELQTSRHHFMQKNTMDKLDFSSTCPSLFDCSYFGRTFANEFQCSCAALGVKSGHLNL